MEGSSEVGGRAGGRRRRVSEAAESQRDALAPKALSVGGRGNFCCAQSQLVPCQCGRPDVWAEDAREEAKGAGDVGGIRILKVTRDRGTEGGTRQSGLFSNTGTGRPREGGSPRSHTPVSAGWLCAVSCCPPQGEGGREKGGADFKVQGPSAFECRGGNRPRGPAQTLAVALPRRGTRVTSHLRASLSSSVKWE